MSFVLSKPDRVKQKIQIKVPRGDALGYEKKEITASIKKLYGDEKQAFMDGLAGKNDVDLIRDLVIDLSGFLTPDNKPIEYGDELLEIISELDFIVTPLARECVMVQDETMRKILSEKN